MDAGRAAARQASSDYPPAVKSALSSPGYAKLCAEQTMEFDTTAFPLQRLFSSLLALGETTPLSLLHERFHGDRCVLLHSRFAGLLLLNLPCADEDDTVESRKYHPLGARNATVERRLRSWRR